MRLRFSALLFLLFALAFAFQGSRGLFLPDEGYYVRIAHEIAQTGDTLIPRLYHEPWLDKPPLSLWGIAAGLKLFGHNEWGARAFHGLCFILTALVAYLLGVSLGGKREGFLGAAIYATMIFPMVVGNVVTPDTPLTLWTTICFFCFWKSVEPDAQYVTVWKMLMCAAFGLGFLTKGPAALIPSGAMFLFLVIQRRAWGYFLTPWAVVGFALFSVLGLSWYAYVAYRVPGALEYFLDNQLLGRTISNKYARNPGLKGALIYLPVVLAGTLPWSLFWLGALKRYVRNMFQKTGWSELRTNPVNLFLTLWITIPLAVFCLASSKLPFYALPVFPALALATARLFSERANQYWYDGPLVFSRRATLTLGLWVFVLIGIKFASSVYPHSRDMRALHTEIEKYFPTGPYEIVSVMEHLEGLGFYSESIVERVTTRDKPYPFFVSPDHLNEEIADLPTSHYTHLFICRKEKQAETVRNALRKSNIRFRETSLPFQRYLFFVDSIPKEGIVSLPGKFKFNY